MQRANHDPIRSGPAGPTGTRLKFLQRAEDTGGELLEVEATFQPHSNEPPEHFHPNQEEHFAVVSGNVRTVIDGQERVSRPGESFIFSAGIPHSMHNVAGEPARNVRQTRPALSTETRFETV